MESILVGVVLGGVLVLREWQNWRDRRDLLDRIMSVDFREYKANSGPRRPPGAHARMTDEEMAKAEREGS